MPKYTYHSETDKNGNITRYRSWIEKFKDGDTGKLHSLKRSRPIKYNGQKIVWYSTAQLKKMTPKQREEIRIK